MDWYWIVLIVAGGLCLLYLLVAFVIAMGTLKSATRPVAHTLDEARDWQQKYENWDFTDYDQVWKRQPFELDGIQGKLHGEVIYNDAKSDRPKVAVICHGHTWNRINSLKYANIFYAKGYNVVIYDHAYFGLSDGTHTTVGDKERHDLSTVLDYTRSIFGKDALLALHGESMGAATVLLELGIRNDIDFVVADCPFSKTMSYYRELCKKLTHLPSFPIVDIANAMARCKYGYNFRKVNPIEGVKASNVPICFIHGAADTFINPHHSADMYKASANPLSEIHLFDGATHARSHCTDKAKYVQVVSDFIDKVEARVS
ncbi:MAG: alpha/beta hydrolase [Clostridiales bacterium]|nr:alpha/beta hydrolase [Clostridiales bacterium]